MCFSYIFQGKKWLPTEVMPAIYPQGYWGYCCWDWYCEATLYPKGTMRLGVSPQWHLSRAALEVLRRHPHVSEGHWYGVMQNFIYGGKE